MKEDAGVLLDGVTSTVSVLCVFFCVKLFMCVYMLLWCTVAMHSTAQISSDNLLSSSSCTCVDPRMGKCPALTDRHLFSWWNCLCRLSRKQELQAWYMLFLFSWCRPFPFPCSRHHLSYHDHLEDKRENYQNCLFCAVLCTTELCTQLWAVLTVKCWLWPPYVSIYLSIYPILFFFLT